MKRAHRSSHHLIWLALVPILAALFWFALTERQQEPVNDTLPPALTEEAA